ncbi:MAG: DUF2961 domain-containing protein [Candidatus Daviesbacteria bacterium]|nr:DUF2961 domain-containing protein [Candidatus Daviesbacteria bacterium]
MLTKTRQDKTRQDNYDFLNFSVVKFYLKFFLIAIFLVGTFLIPMKVLAVSWWNTSYQYRQNIKITSSNAIIPQNGTLTTTIDTQSLINAGKLRGDGKDLRLVYYNGSTNSEIDYTINFPSTRLLNNIGSSDTAVYIDDGDALPASGKVQIDDEIISYTGVSQTAVATPSSNNAGNIGPVTNINDGDITTANNNIGDFVPAGWYELDFPGQVTFNEVRFKEASWADGWIESSVVQYWDGDSWESVGNATLTPTPPAAWGDKNLSWYKSSFDSVTSTKMRLSVTQGGAALFSGLYELEVFNSPSATNLARQIWQLTGVSRGADSTTAASHTSLAQVRKALISSTTTEIVFKVQSRIETDKSDSGYYLYYGHSDENTSPATNSSNVYLFADEFTSSSLNASLTLANTTGLAVTENNAHSSYYHINLPYGYVFDYITGTNNSVTLYHPSPFLDWTIETSLDTFGNFAKHAGIAVSFGKTVWDTYLYGVWCGYLDEVLGSACRIRVDNANSTLNLLSTSFTGAYGIAGHVQLKVRKISDTYYFDYRLNNSSDFTNLGSLKTCCSTNDYGIDPVNIGLFSKDWVDTKQLDDSYFDYLRVATNTPSANYSVNFGTERTQATTGSVSTGNSSLTTTNPIIVPGHDTLSPITLTLRDSYGDPISGKQITFTSSRSGDSFSASSGTTDVNGQLTTNLTASTTAGTSNITATDSDGNAVTATSLITVQSIEPIGFDLYNNLYRLPYLDPNLQTLQTSSVDLNQLNADGGPAVGVSKFLYKDSNDEYVILDEKGPGILYRFWMTKDAGLEADLGNIRFYLDGSATPALDTNVNTLFGGSYQNLAFPIVSNRWNAAGGFHSFLPITFASSLKITTTNNTNYYYNITYQKLPSNASLTSYTTSDSNTKLLNLFNSAGLDPKSTSGNTTLTGSTALADGNTATIVNLSGNGSIQSLKLTFNPKTKTVLNGTYLQMYWDGESTPSVNVPIGYFFGTSEGTFRVRSMFVGYDDYNDQFYVYFPMPYGSSAVIKLTNSSGIDITAVSYAADYKTSVYENVGKEAVYFKANYVSDTPATGQNLIALDTSGRGRIVGFLNDQGGPAEGMEGNERVYINANKSPQIEGTGTEDFFNAAWGFEGLNFLKPLSGNPYGAFASTPITMYTIMPGHSFNYENGVKFELQHGPTSNIVIPYNAVTLYYGSSIPGISLTDTLDVDNSSSETSHSYSKTNQTSSGSQTYTYPGSVTTSVADDGRVLTGTSQFTASISSTNLGVILRRRLDYGTANQTATVSVDGTDVGTWYDAGSNSVNKWRDSNFWIPSTYTDGKSSITVKITSTDGNAWNEYYYWVYSIDNLLEAPTVSAVSSSPTSSATTITWATNKTASSKIDYGLTSSYGSSTTETDISTRVSSHSVSLSNLVACTTYHYRVRSVDAASNETIDSDNTFTTTGCTGSASVSSQASSNITAASGGSVSLLSSGKGLSLIVPASFAGSDANFQIKQLEKTAALATTSVPSSGISSGGYGLIGNYIYQLGALTDLATSLSTFNQPITITMTYGSSDVTSIDESTLKIFRWDGSSWHQLSGCSVDTSAKTVSCSTSNFSTFGLFGQTTTQAPAPASAPSCNDITPTGIPNLFQISTTGSSAKLTFTTFSSGVTGYNIFYGYTLGDERFSSNVDYTGSLWVLDTTINNLAPNTTYYFKVRAKNGCTAGSWSSSLSAKTLNPVEFSKLEIVSSELTPQTKTEESLDNCSTYTVQSGDTLWSIASRLLGDGSKYKNLINQNNDKYPSLENSNNLKVGWELKVNCEKQEETGETQKQSGYDVKVKIMDTNKKPVEGATVTLHSTPQTTKTDKDGTALFHNVEQGDHKVLIAYSGFQGEQSINLTGDVKEFDLNVTVKPQSVLLSPIVIGIVSAMAVVIVVLGFLLMRSKNTIKNISKI